MNKMLNKTGGSKEDVESRIQNGWVAFPKPKLVWNSRICKLKTKIRLFNSIVKSTVMYGNECRKAAEGLLTDVPKADPKAIISKFSTR